MGQEEYTAVMVAEDNCEVAAKGLKRKEGATPFQKWKRRGQRLALVIVLASVLFGGIVGLSLYVCFLILLLPALGLGLGLGL
jgi:hypothetical protein